MKGIEFICAGGNCRSVMAREVARKRAREIAADIPIYSSGVLVDEFFSVGPYPRVVAALKSMGIEGEPVELTKKFIEMESKQRNEALKIRKYDAVENHIPQQTDLKKDIDLVLVVADKEKKALLEKFPEAKAKTITEYTSSSYQEMDAVSLQDWLTNVKYQLQYLDGLIKVMPSLIDRYICEFH